MPVKKHKTHHKPHGEKHRRSKKFLKVYAPYIPLLIMVGLSIFLAGKDEFKHQNDKTVLSYATDISKQELLEYTNINRTSNGQKKLQLNAKLSQAAQAKARDMSTRDYWSHVSPDGKKPWYFIKNTGYDYAKAAENLAFGFDNSKSTVNGWMNSADHRANMLDSKLREVGFGIVDSSNYQDKGPQTLVVAMYAAPDNLVKSPLAQQQRFQNSEVLADEQKITQIQSLTAGNAPWSGLAVGIIFGAVVMYLLLKHVRSIRRLLLYGERFIIKHPVLDASLVAFAILAVMLSQTSGFIL